MKFPAVLLLILSLRALGFDPNLVAENKTRPTAFVGVPWGANPNDAVRILGERAGAVAPEELPADRSKVELTGGNFSGQPAEKWTLEFANGKFFAATVMLKADGAARARYRDIKQMLVGKYGPPARDGKPPIAIGPEKKNRVAQQQFNPDQKLFGNTVAWKFTPTLSDKEPKTIELTLATTAGTLATDETQLVVQMRYVNEAFAAPAAATKTSKSAKPAGPDDL